jgi:hypothetical protein
MDGIYMVIALKILALICCIRCSSCSDNSVESDGGVCWNKTCGLDFDPYSPLINCCYV